MLNVGTLIALLKLQDEMSPALLDASTRLSSFGSAATSAGLALTAGITAPLTALAYAAISTGVEFESVMNQIQGVLTPTAAEMEVVRQKAMEMGTATVFSASEAATAILELGKAGFTTSEAIAGVDDVMLLAAASGMEMAAAAEFAAKTIQGFGLDVSDLAHVNDVLAAAVSQTALDISDLTVAFGYIGPIATSFGISLEQASAALAIMVEAGVPAETAARSLRDALTDLVDPVGKTAEAMEMLGIETFKTADGSLMPFADIISLLESKAVTAEQALMLFGKQSGGPMATLVLAGRDALDQLTQSFENSDGAAQKMADAMMSGLPGALEFLRGSVDTLFITLSKQLEPAIISVAGFIEGLADFVTAYVIPAFTELPTWVQGTAIGLTALLAAAGPVLTMFGFMASGIGSLITLYGTLVPATGAAAVAAGLLTTAVTALGYAFAGATVGIATYTATAALMDWSGLSNNIEYAWLRLEQWLGGIDSAATKEDLWNSVLANTARRMGEVDAATANSYGERAKLTGVVEGTTMAEIEFNEILGGAGGVNQNLTANADAAKKAAEMASFLATNTSTMNALIASGTTGLEGYGDAILGKMAISDADFKKQYDQWIWEEQQSIKLSALMREQVIGIEGISDAYLGTMAASDTYFTRDYENNVRARDTQIDLIDATAARLESELAYMEVVGASSEALAAKQLELDAAKVESAFATEIARFEAATSGVDQTSELYALLAAVHEENMTKIMLDAETAAAANVSTWRDAIAAVADTLGSLAGLFGVIADASGASWAEMAAQGAQFATNMIDIWTNPETGIVDKIINSAIEIGKQFGDALHDSGGEKTMRDVGRDWGVAITEELGDAIYETAETLFGGDRTAAQIFHLTDILESAGGLSDVNFDTFVGKLRDVFVMLETGMFDASHAVTVLEENWQTFVEQGIDGAGRLKPELVEIMDLALRFGLQSEAMAVEFTSMLTTLVGELDLSIRENFELASTKLNEMLLLVAAGTLSAADAVAVLDETWATFVENGTNAVTGLLDPALRQVIVSMRELGLESEAVTEYIKEQLHTVVEGLTERVSVFGAVIEASLEDGIGASERLDFVLKALGTDTEGLQGEFDRLGVFTVATFGALVSEGASLRDALDLISDSLDQLATAEHVLGLEGSAAIEQLLGFREIVKANEDVFTSIDGLQKMMTGLANTGYLTAEVFAAFGTDLTAQFTTLTERGVDVNQALLLMQPSLQTLWELQQQFGFEVDAGTQALLDQAEAAGLVGGAFQDVMERIEDILLAIAEALGAKLPEYFTQIQDSATGTFDRVGSDYTSLLGGMEAQTAETVSALQAEWNSLTGGTYIINPLTGEPYIDTSREPIPFWDYTPPDYVGPGYPGYVPPGTTTPGGMMPGSGTCCGPCIGPVFVMDGTSPSVGALFVKALLDELRRGSNMDAFRDLVCDAMTC